LDGEKLTVAEILGVEGVGREGEEAGGGGSVVGGGGFGLGAKKREMTCCFCLPIFVVVGVAPVVVVDLFAKIWRASNFVGNMFEEMRGKSYQVRVGYHQRFYTHTVTVNKIQIFDYLSFE
jgi:hypothetical protein